MAADSKDGAGSRPAGDGPQADKDVDRRFKRAVRNLLATPKKPAKPKPHGPRPVVTERKKPGR